MFLHADIFHILFNMYFLYIFGREVESTLGTGKFLALYFISGLAASFFHIAFTPITGIHTVIIPALGASGAISGVLGAYLLLFPNRRVTICWFMWIIPWCFTTLASYYLIFWFALQVVYGYARLGSVAFFAHAGGFVAGIASLGLFKPRIRPSYYMYMPSWYYNGGFFVEPHYLHVERGLGSVTKSVLLILLAALLTGSMYSIIAGYSMETGLYLYNVNVKVGNDLVTDVAVYSIDKGIVFLPVEDEPRIVVNRLNWAGLFRGPPNSEFNDFVFNDMIPTMFRGIKVHLYLNSIMKYDGNGVLVYSSGKMITDVLEIRFSRVYIVRDREFVYSVEAKSVVENIGSSLIVPFAILSAIVTIMSIYVVYAKDKELVIE